MQGSHGVDVSLSSGTRRDRSLILGSHSQSSDEWLCRKMSIWRRNPAATKCSDAKDNIPYLRQNVYLCVYLRAKELFKWLLSVNSFLVSETVGGVTPPIVYCVSDVIRALPVIGQEAGAHNMAAPSSRPSTWTPHLSSQSVLRCHPGWTGVKRRCLYSVCRSLADIQKWIYSICWWTSISVLCERYVNCQHRWPCKIHMYIYFSLREYSFMELFWYFKCHNIRSKSVLVAKSEGKTSQFPISV